MIKARDMVRLAGELNERLTASSSLASNLYGSPSDGASAASSFLSSSALVPSTEPEEATFVRSSLVQLGLQMQNTPVTLDMIRDEKRWHEELARELAGVLQGTGGKSSIGLMRDRGIIGLDEVWGGWNRARGIGASPTPPSLPFPSLPFISLIESLHSRHDFGPARFDVQRSSPRQRSCRSFRSCRRTQPRPSASAHSPRPGCGCSTRPRTRPARSQRACAS